MFENVLARNVKFIQDIKIQVNNDFHEKLVCLTFVERP